MPPEDSTPPAGGETPPAPSSEPPKFSGTDTLPPDDPNGEGTTAEEVAKILGKPQLAPPKPADDDNPNGDDEEEPTPAAGAPKEGDEEETPPEGTPPATPPAPEAPKEEKPAPKPEAPAVEENGYPKELADLEVEDAEGVTYKISKITDLPEDFDPKNNRQIIEIIDNVNKLAADRADFDKTKAEREAEEAQDEQVQEIQAGWNKEIEQLKADKRIDATDPTKADARVQAVYNHMGEVNAERVKNGMARITSFEDALNSLERKEAKDAKAAKEKSDKDQRRKDGSLVGGASAPASGGGTPYKPGTARTAQEAIRHLKLV